MMAIQNYLQCNVSYSTPQGAYAESLEGAQEKVAQRGEDFQLCERYAEILRYFMMPV